MCVFLCANSNIYTWLDRVLTQAQRQVIPISSLCPGHPCDSRDIEGRDDVESAPDPIVERSRGEVWHARWNQSKSWPNVDRASAHERHKPLDALANAWSRLLVLVGWRC